MVGIGDNGGLSGGPEHRTRARRSRPPRAYVVEEQGAGRRGRRTRGRPALLGAAQARTRATPTRPLKAMVPAMWPAPWPRHLRSAMAFKVFPFPWFVVANASRRACRNGKSAPVPDFTPISLGAGVVGGLLGRRRPPPPRATLPRAASPGKKGTPAWGDFRAARIASATWPWRQHICYHMAMERTRVVVDTNVIASALTSATGTNREVMRRCLQGLVEPLISNTLFHEYESLVRRPSVHARCPLTPRERDDLLDAFLGACVWVRISFRWRPNLRDESDNHLIELAVAGGAMAIVTNNVRDLRSGELVFPDIGIMTPAEFMKSLRKRP